MKWVSKPDFQSDGKTLANGSVDTIRFWGHHHRRRKGLRSQGLPANIVDLSFSPDGKTIVSVTGDSEICVFGYDHR